MVGIEGTTGSVTPTTHRVSVTETNELVISLNSKGIGPAELDESTHNLNIITQEHHEIHKGNSFVVCISGVGGNGTEINLLLTTANGSTWNHIIHAARSNVEANFKIFEGGTWSGAVAQDLTPINRNRNAAIDSITTVKQNIVISGAIGVETSGLQLVEEHFGGGRTGGESRATQQEWTLKSGTEYLFRLTSEAASADLDIELNWYEHTNKTQLF